MATIHHGIDIRHFTFSNSHNNYLVFFGRIHPDKGVHNAIEIARRSGKELVIAGVIQDKNYYRDFVYPYIDDKQIHYIGSVNPTERNKLLGNAQALLHPISFKEPFGLSVIESMACGTPPVAFNRGSMSEIITSGHDGFLVNTVDEAVVKLDSIDSVNRINCRKTVEKRFTSERMIRDYISIYNRIITHCSHL
jgi:glycosyltransferase involved in cell wall biosynthesis